MASRNVPLTVALVALILSACSSNDHATTPISESQPGASTRPAPRATPTSARQAIEQAYTKSWVVSVKAAKATPEEARRLLEPYAAGGYLEAVLRGIRELQAQGREPWGKPVVHITKISILPGGTASVHDCQD